MHAERQNRRVNIMFAGRLKPSQEAWCGYALTYNDWIERAMISHADLDGGPCKINLGENALPMCNQLWPYVKRTISKAAKIMEPLLTTLGSNRQ